MNRGHDPYAIELRRAAARALAELQKRDPERVSQDRRQSTPAGRRKANRSDLYRVWSGDYRVFYAIDDRRVVNVQSVGNRRDIDRQ